MSTRMQSMVMRTATCLCLAGVVLVGIAQTPAVTPKSDADIAAESKQAEALYQAGKTLDSLPLYEDLHAQRPLEPKYTELLAMAYVAKGGAEVSPDEKVKDRNHARELLRQILAQGKTSDLVQIMVEKMGPPETAPTAATAVAAPAPEWRQIFNQAELLFNKGDLKGSVELYRKSWEQNPQFYSAPLFAGDAEYKLGHYDQAGVWFQRAIDINPDIETAHRYWADCLAKAGKPEQAHKQYVEAFIADPYQKAPRLELRAWAQANRLRFVAPPIALPAGPTTGKDGHINITLDASAKPDASAIALAYSLNASVWQIKKFKDTYPDAKAYRHTLQEEVEGMKAMLEVIHRQKLPEDKLDATSRSLLLLEKDNMLECWVLLDNPDNGTAQDYATFRATHGELLRAYVEKYDLHPA